MANSYQEAISEIATKISALQAQYNELASIAEDYGIDLEFSIGDNYVYKTWDSSDDWSESSANC